MSGNLDRRLAALEGSGAGPWPPSWGDLLRVLGVRVDRRAAITREPAAVDLHWHVPGAEPPAVARLRAAGYDVTAADLLAALGEAARASGHAPPLDLTRFLPPLMTPSAPHSLPPVAVAVLDRLPDGPATFTPAHVQNALDGVRTAGIARADDAAALDADGVIGVLLAHEIVSRAPRGDGPPAYIVHREARPF